MKLVIISLFLLVTCSRTLAQSDYQEAEPFSVWRRSQQMKLEYVKRLEEQLAADPDNVARQLDLGRAYYLLALEREEAAQFQAEKIFQQILTGDPENAVALAYHGSLLGLKVGSNLVPKGRIVAVGKQAFEELDRAVQLAPDSVEVRDVRGYSSFYTPSFLGRDQLAIEDFTHIIRLLKRVPGSEEPRAEVYLILGDSYRKMDNWANARSSWRQASQLVPGSRLALAAEARLQSDQGSDQNEIAVVRIRELIAFFGFLLGVMIFAILTVLVLRDLIQARRRRGGIAASLFVSLVALLWNGLNLMLVILNALGSQLAEPLQPTVAWNRHSFSLALAFSPIPFGLAMAYRFYKAAFMDIALKRGTALLVILILSMIYARLLEVPIQLAIFQVSDTSLRSIFYTGGWLSIFALYLPLRNHIYRLVDRYLFKRRDYSQLLNWFHDRLRGVTDEASLMTAVSDALKEAFAADSARFVLASSRLAARLSTTLAEQKTDVMLRRQIVDDELHAELEKQRVELALAIRSNHEMLSVILIGPRAYGQGYLSEELSVLRAMAAQIGRMLENLRLHEARRQQSMAEAELRKLAAQAELKALRAQIDPHFFFNALNSVASLTSEDPEAAEALIEDMTELFRQAFNPGREFISLGQELDLVETYVKVEKVRLGEKLQFKKAVPPDTLSLRIPVLIIQPLIENAVKHGIGRSQRGGSITLSAAVSDGSLNVSVADTGAGIPPSALSRIFSCGVGLANVNNRLVGLYGQEAALRIDSLPGEGTTVSFAIPLGVEPATS